MSTRGRTSFSSLQPTFLRLSFFSPRAFRFSSRFISYRFALFPRGRCAHHFSRARPLASPVGDCSPEHSSLANLPRVAAYLGRRCSRVRFVRSFVRSFAIFCTQLLFSSRFAQLSSALLAPLLFSCLDLVSAPLVPRLQPLSLRASSSPLFQARYPSSHVCSLLLYSYTCTSYYSVCHYSACLIYSNNLGAII